MSRFAFSIRSLSIAASLCLGGRFNLRGNSHGGITDVAFRISRCAFERNRFDSEFVQIAVAA